MVIKEFFAYGEKVPGYDVQVLNELCKDVQIPPHDLSVFCIMNMGGHEATLIQSGILYGGKTDIACYSPISKMMKWGG